MSAPRAPGSAILRYEITEVISTGGTGDVYRARDAELARDVAIKVVAPQSGRDVKDMLADARAIAKVGHRALVPIFDVGTVDDRLCLVMPHLTGGTLHDWLRAERRPWGEVADRFVKAGRGLAAAHDAGLVHGDFTAKSVLLERDDVLVGDVGLRGGADAGDGAQVDQRAFATAFRDALAGGEPAWLGAVLARGRDEDAGKRWPSLGAMLDRIDARRRLPARLTVGVVALAGLAAGITVTMLAMRDATPAPCSPPTARVAAVWSPAARADLERAMLATGVPYAADAAARVLPAIDAYVGEWQAMYIATCRATEVARTQAPAMLDRRMRCLDQRLAALATRMPALLESDRTAVQKSIATMTGLPAIADCGDAQALERIQPLPAAPERRAEIQRVETELAELEAFGIRGDLAEMLRRAHALAARTRVQDYGPLHVAALHVLADAQARNEQNGETTLRELAAVAARAGDDASLSVAWSSLVHTLVTTQRFDEARQLVQAATTATARTGNRQRAMFMLRLATGALACETGDRAGCIRDLKEAVTLAPSPTRKLSALYNLVSAYVNPGDWAGGRPVLDEYIALAEELTGPNHPAYGDALYLKSFFLQSSGDPADLDRARVDLEKALAIRVDVFGENHPDVAHALILLAHVAGSQAKPADTEKHSRRALAIGEAVKSASVQIEALRVLAASVSDQGRIDEARPYYDRALAKVRELYGPDARDVASIAASYAATLMQAEDCAGAKPHAADAFRILDRDGDPQAVVSLLVMAQCAVASGAVEEGVAHFERGLVRCGKPGSCATGHLETVQGYYGMWLVESRRDRRRGGQLLRAARDTFAKMGRAGDVAEIDAFLAKHHVAAER